MTVPKPFEQGDLDGLCGAYAVVNVVRLAAHPHRRLPAAERIDRDLAGEQPMQTAWGWVSPLLALPVPHGPPHVGPAGWLFHLDAPNLLLQM